MSPRLYLTGRLLVEHDERVVLDQAVLPGRLGRLAFAFLASRWRRPASRVEIVEALWDRDPPDDVDATLSPILSRLRAVLRTAPFEARLVVEHGVIELRLPPSTWIDIDAAVNSLDEAEGACRRGDPASGWGAANIAVAIARRPFLPAEDGPWIEACRRRLTNVLSRGLQCLSVISEAIGETSTAVRHAEEVIALEPYRETAYHHLMRLHAAMGNTAEAIRVFGRCREHLRDELGVSPSAESERLYLEFLKRRR